MTGIKTIAVIGTGTIGAGWAAYFLSRGLAVRAFDPQPASLAQLPERITFQIVKRDFVEPAGRNERSLRKIPVVQDSRLLEQLAIDCLVIIEIGFL